MVAGGCSSSAEAWTGRLSGGGGGSSGAAAELLQPLPAPCPLTTTVPSRSFMAQSTPGVRGSALAVAVKRVGGLDPRTGARGGALDRWRPGVSAEHQRGARGRAGEVAARVSLRAGTDAPDHGECRALQVMGRRFALRRQQAAARPALKRKGKSSRTFLHCRHLVRHRSVHPCAAPPARRQPTLTAPSLSQRSPAADPPQRRPQDTRMDYAAKAREWAEKADKRLRAFSLFGGNKYEDAAEMYEKAANQFKLAKACGCPLSDGGGERRRAPPLTPPAACHCRCCGGGRPSPHAPACADPHRERGGRDVHEAGGCAHQAGEQARRSVQLGGGRQGLPQVGPAA